MLPQQSLPQQSSQSAIDVYLMSAEQKSKYENQFLRISPSGRSSFITGDDAKQIMIQSGLGPQILAKIWALADVDADGRMDINEFCIALHLIALKLKGVELPQQLPQSLRILVEPPSFAAFGADFGSFGTAPLTSLPTTIGAAHGQSTIMTGAGIPPPRPAPPAEAKLQRSGSLTSGDYPASMMLTEWAIPQPSKLKYTQQFNTHDRTRTGYLTGPQSRNILVQSQLPNPILAQIWNLSDIDSDGRLTCDEYVLAMHLIDCVRAGDTLPPVLPPDLIPPSYRRKKSLSGSAIPIVMPSVAPTGEAIPEESKNLMSAATFEDKRRENFEKGQAELERRRHALMEQQRREREERERKEREEQMKREQIRVEQERKRMAEVERQVQKQREIETEKEEQRRKQLEQREAARREMERQRMLEWENTRKQELIVQKGKTQEEVQKLRSRKKALAIETEQINNKVNELTLQVTDTRKKVVDVKAEIDSMRLERDQKLGLLSSVKAQMKSLSDRQLIIEQEKSDLSNQMKTLSLNSDVNSADRFTIQNKQININKLKTQLEEYEKEREQKLQDVTNNNGQLRELKDKLNDMITKTTLLTQQYESKREEAREVRDQHQQIQIEDVNAGWGQTPAPDQWTAHVANVSAPRTSDISKVKYRVMYAFEARNADELTIEPGDIVTVNTSACSEPGWLSGEVNGRIGWFPEQYVERMDDTLNDNTFDLNTTPIVKETEESIVNSRVSAFTTSEDSRFQPPVSSNVKIHEPSQAMFRAVAMYPWKAKEENHLSFAKGDIIGIKEQQDMWWFGELGSATGWFPKSYVKSLSVGEEPPQDEEFHISMYPFESQEDGDLAFDTGELIKVVKKDGDWWTGVIADHRNGIFPSNYVRPATAEEIPKPIVAEPTVPAPKTKAHAPPAPIGIPPPASEPSQVTTTPPPGDGGDKSKLKKPEIVTVIAPYKATGPEQLSLDRGQLVNVRKKTSSGWWEGEIQSKGRKKQVGWFPASYVKGLSGGTGSGGSSARSTPDPVKQPDQELAQHDDELSFENNEVIKVLAKDDTTWWKGQSMTTGIIGLFPSNHVEPYREYEEIDHYNNADDENEDFDESEENTYAHIDDETFETEALNSTKLVLNSINTLNENSVLNHNEAHLHTSNPNANHKINCDEISNHNIYNNLLLTDIERERQNRIDELISTERSYVKHMEIVIDVFQIPLQQCLTNEEVSAIFVNWKQLVQFNQRFLKAIKSRKRNTKSSKNGKNAPIVVISDILCDFLSQMPPVYIEFCSRQLSAAKLIQWKTENDDQFKDIARRCSQDPRANRLPLSSFLLKPMQRITKYPMLIAKIVENTPEDHPDYDHCKRAYEISQKLCNSVNEACRAREDGRRLEWIQRHVKIEGTDQVIVLNSPTNCLGPRQCLHSGSLIKANSGKELIAFLFNDFLLLTIPNKELGRVTNVFSSDKALAASYRMYKMPLMLSDLSICELSQFETGIDPMLFQLNNKSHERNLMLRAASANERSLWIRCLDVAIRDFKDVQRTNASINKSSTYPRSGRLKGIGRLLVTVIEAERLTTKNSILNAYCRLTFSSSSSSSSSLISKDCDEQSKSLIQTHETKVIRCIPLNHLSSAPSLHSHTKNHNHSKTINLYNAKWNDTTQFIIHDILTDVITLECNDCDPFSPHYHCGSVTIKVSDLSDEMHHNAGPLKKTLKLVIKGDNVNVRRESNDTIPAPIIHIKLDMQKFDR